MSKDPLFQNDSLSYGPTAGLHQPAPGFSRSVLSLQYQTSSHSTNLQIQEKMALTQSLWYLFLTYESRTASESSTSRFSLRQVIEPL